MRKALRRVLALDANLLQLVLLALLVFALMTALVPDKFLRPYNLLSITYIAPELGLLAIAMMVAMLTGGIDLSVIGIANLGGILAGLFFHAYGGARGPGLAAMGALPVAAGIAIAVATGLIAGTVNGFLISRLRVTPILATLGSGQVFTGIALVLTGGPAIVGFPDRWTMIGNGAVGGIALPLIVLLALAGGTALLLGRTAFGISLVLIGTNPKAAVFAGLRTRRALLLTYVLTGALASVAGILLSARTNAAKSDYGISYLLQAVLIAVLGGTDPAGGRGSVAGVIVALLALMLLASGMQLMRFSNFLVDAMWGVFLLASIALNAWRTRPR
ncbi:MAG: ABC transporter permease [Acidibrevibacterium sp.]|uniref:ABC transporter permease n=1 Tax=Acidibrevibacterium sp. TaxID=2606776 RepID=UPI003D06DC87